MDERNHFAHRIPQEVDVSWKMDIGLDHEGIAAPGKITVLFPKEGVTFLDHQASDLVHHFRCQE